MRGLFLIALVLCACNGEDKPDPVEPAGTGSVISVGSSVSSAGSSGTYGSSDGGSSGSSSAGDSSSSGGPTCMIDGEACADDGVCIELEDGFACGHGVPGDACVLPEDCASGYCVPQPTELDAPGICTGNACDVAMAECEVDGKCFMVDAEMLRCSHGEIGEPCITDDDCDGGRCQQYPGDVLVCAAP